MKKVIMLATYFPPAGGISTFRITKFVKYMRYFDWEPIVLTLDEMSYRECNFLIDQSLIKDIPENLTIYRTGLSKKPFLFKNLFNNIVTRWLPPLFSKIKYVVKKERPDLLFATGDPFFPLLAAPFANLLYGLKYVIDLRDPWKLEIPLHSPKGVRGKLKRPINNFLEPIVLNRASKVICVSEGMCKQYREAYPMRPPEDFIAIPNGFDTDDYDSVPAVAYPQFTVVYAGKFLSGTSFRSPEYFLEALKILKVKNIKICFKHIGEMNPEIIAMVKKAGLSDQFESVGLLSYRDTISNMKGAGILLLIGNGQETEQTGKIFDYLGCKRPIMALASKNSGIADVVQDIEEIVLIENKDAKNIAVSLEEMYNKRNMEPIERANISKYLRKKLTADLAAVFNEVITQSKK